MGKRPMAADRFLRVIHQARYPRAMTAVIAAPLAILIDLIFRFSDYRSQLHSLSVGGSMMFAAALTLALLQVIAFFYLFLLLPRIPRTVALLPCAFVAVVQFTYWLTLSHFMTGTDLFLALTVGGENRLEAIASFFRPVVLLYTLPHVLVLSALILAPFKSAFRKTLALGLLPALYLFASNYFLFSHAPERNFHLNPFTSFIRVAFHYQFETHRGYSGPRDDLPAFPSAQRPLDSIIYVIDESVRGSNLSLNGYPRPTTPFLQSLETGGRLRNLGICVAASAFSHISNAYLVTGHNAFPDYDFRTAKNPTLFDYAKKMGYETIYIDINHGHLSPLLRAARGGPARSLDWWMTEQSFKERHMDLATSKDLCIARFLSVLLNERGGYFILVNKKGLHFQYRNRYPNDPVSTVWKPVMEASEVIDPSAAGREKLVNTYDNGIRFQVDEFFRVFVSDTTNRNYVLLYTSDHGQTLSEHGQAYTHMMPDKVIADVPGFLVVSEEYERKGLLAAIPPGVRASHLNNFATLLDLMGVPMSLRVRPYEKSLFSLTGEDNKERYYMSGSLHGLGDYAIRMIPTPPDEGWGVSLSFVNGPGSGQ